MSDTRFANQRVTLTGVSPVDGNPIYARTHALVAYDRSDRGRDSRASFLSFIIPFNSQRRRRRCVTSSQLADNVAASEGRNQRRGAFVREQGEHCSPVAERRRGERNETLSQFSCTRVAVKPAPGIAEQLRVV